MTRIWQILSGSEKALAIAAMSLMSLLPVVAMAARQAGMGGVPGSIVIVQYLALWVAFLGASLGSAGDRMLSLSANTFLPEKWASPVNVFSCGITGMVSASLCWASYQFMLSQKEAGTILALARLPLLEGY